MLRRRGAFEDLVRRRCWPAREQRDKHDSAHRDELEHLRAGVEDTVKDPGAVQDGTAGSDRVAPAGRFQLPGTADHIIHFFTAVTVKRSVMTGVNLDDAEAEAHHIEASLGIDQLQVSDRAAGLLHRRAVEVLSGIDDDAFCSESLFGCTHLVVLLDNENETIRNYRKRVRQCEALGECALAEQLRAILVQEQDHQIDLATALGVDVPDVTKPDERA